MTDMVPKLLEFTNFQKCTIFWLWEASYEKTNNIVLMTKLY